MTTTPPFDQEIDLWFASWVKNNLPVYMSAGGFPWGGTVRIVVCAWTTNTGNPTFMVMDPTSLNGSNVVPAAEPIQLSGLTNEYGVTVRVYDYQLPGVPALQNILADDATQEFYNDQENWCQAP